MVDKSKSELGRKRVADLIERRTFEEIKTAVEAFLAAVDEVHDELNGMLVWDFCRRLTDALTAWAEPYTTVPRGSKLNAVIVPPEHAPLMLLKFSLTVDGSPNDIVNGLKKFIGRCDEFVPPICGAITETEISRVLNAAQKAYRLVDIVAPKEPLKILRFNYSHTVYNSQCGLSDNPDCPATVLLYHPKASDVHDRVFIFAHELGHALHQTLTGDVETAPEGFEKFHESVSAKWNTVKEMQECFADAAALSILNVKGLGAHFPSRLSIDMSPNFARFLRGLCESALKKAGKYTEPLPSPNLMWQAKLYPPR
ncbi:MAG: hypothetical protein LBK57_10110 [Clostridiales Family XIII bacterium]|nr:hypothetical protein [Clostridiales Family XIII bacterium]